MVDMFNPYGEQQEEEEGFLEGLVKAPVRGVAGAVAGVANLFGADVQDNFGLGKSQGTFAGFAEGITQFLVGFIPASRALSAVGFLSRAEKAGKFAKATAVMGKGAAAGAVADFAVFDGNDERLSNLIQAVPILQNPVTEYLASSQDDSEVEGRFKNVLEGLGLGAVTESIYRIFKKKKAYNKAVAEGDTPTAAKLDEEIADEAEEALAPPMREEPEVEVREEPQEPQVVRPQEPEPEVETSSKTPLVDDRETITETAVRERIAPDPKGGDIILSVGSAAEGSDIIRGLVDYGQVVREPGARLEILQLKADAEVVTLGTSKAKRLIGDAKRFGQDKKMKLERQIEAAKAAGIDALKIKRDGKTEVLVLNPDAVDRRINVKSTEPFWQTQKESLSNPNIREDIVALSRVESYLRTRNFTPEKYEQALSYWKQIEDGDVDIIPKLRGHLNYDKASTTEVAEFDQMVGEFMGVSASNKAKVSWDDDAKAAANLGYVSKAHNTDDKVIMAQLSQMADDSRDIRRRLAAIRVMLDGRTKRHIDMVKTLRKAVEGGEGGVIEWGGKSLTPEEFSLMLHEDFLSLSGMQNSLGSIRSETGRQLKSFDAGVNQILSNPEIRAANDSYGGLDRALKNGQKFVDALEKMGTAAGLGFIKAQTRRNRIFRAIMDWYYFGLLSGPKTITTNATGSSATMAYRSFESWLGGKWGSKVASDPAKAAALKQEAANRLRTLDIMRQSFVDAAKHMTGKGDVADSSVTWLGDVLKDVGDSAREGVGKLTGKAGWMEGQKPVQNLSAENLDLDPLSPVGRFVNWMGKVSKIPGKLMVLTDEAVKQITYRSYIQADLEGQFLAKNPKATKEAMEAWVEKELKTFSINGQAFTEANLRREAERQLPREHFADMANRDRQIEAWIEKRLEDGEVLGRSALAERALKMAEEVTFTNRVDPKDARFLTDLGDSIQKLANKHPAIKLFAPFIKTPLNILMFAGDRSIIPGLNRDILPAIQYVINKKMLGKNVEAGKNRWVQQITSSDPKVVADAYGRMGTALGFTAFMGTAAMNGSITGRGPQDPERKKALQQAGWQEYSIKVGDTYVSYQRGDPFASIMAYFADWADIVRYSDEEQGVDDIAISGLFSVITNLESKSYLQGITDLVKVLDDPVNALEQTGARVTGTLVVPNLIASARSFTDTTMPENSGFLDRVFSRVPLLAGGMEPQRNVLGEPVNKKAFTEGLQRAEGVSQYFLPVTLNVTSSDIISQELADLVYPVSPPRPEKFGVDLRDIKNDSGQSAYDRWQQLTGEVKLEGRNLRSAMERMIKSKEYQRIPDQALDSVDLDSPKVSMIRNLIGQYRREAERQMLKEYPELRNRVNARLQAKDLLRSGRSVDELLEGLK